MGAAVLLLCTLGGSVAAPPAGDDKALAAELLSLPDAAARDRWLDAHRAALTAGLGRELNAAARVHYLASEYPPAFDGYSIALRVGEIANDPETRIRALEGLGNVERFRGRPQEAQPWLERAMDEAKRAGDGAAEGRILGGIGVTRRMM